MPDLAAILDEFGAPVAENPWPSRLLWPFMAALGFVVFELTADPILGVVVACLKFGASEASTASWIARHDPIPTRGRACIWFLIARGLGKIAVAALIAFFSCFFLASILESIKHNNKLMNDIGDKHALAGFITFLLVLMLMIPAMILGLFEVRRSGFKIWIDGWMNQARKRRLWPPFDPFLRRTFINNVRILIWITNVGTALFVLTACLFAIGIHWNFIDVTPLIVYLLLIPIVLTLCLWFGARLIKRHAARTPWECWPELLERRNSE